MEKKVKSVKIEKGMVTINLKNGKKQNLPSKTTYTYYEDGSNDCNIQIEKPIKLSGNSQEVK